MITGYNTDVEHDGVVYHVQTEDKGLETPIVLSLVYSGGAILASKRSPYQDLIAAGFDEAALTERLKRQHRLICAAIHAGRIDDLKGMKERRAGSEAASESESTSPPIELENMGSAPVMITDEIGLQKMREAALAAEAANGVSAYSEHDPRRQSALGEPPARDEGLRIGILNEEQDFRGGQSIELQLAVTRGLKQGEKQVGGAAVSVKILGTTFRPLIQSVKTNREGIVSVFIRIPPFTSGRAAILVKATADNLSTETRRIIYPGK